MRIETSLINILFTIINMKLLSFIFVILVPIINPLLLSSSDVITYETALRFQISSLVLVCTLYSDISTTVGWWQKCFFTLPLLNNFACPLVMSSADIEVQLVQLNHCDGVYSNYWNTLLRKLKTLAIHQFLFLDPPLCWAKNIMPSSKFQSR